MKKTLIIISSILLFSATVCGFWIGAQEAVEQSSVNFHMMTALGGVLIVFASMFIKGKPRKNEK